MILISTGIQVMESDLIENQVFHFQVVEMYWFLGQIWVLLPILIIRKKTLVLGKGPTQGLENTLTAEKMYSINFTVTKKRFCLSLLYNEANSCLFVNGTEIYIFKPNNSEIVPSLLCLGNISKDWSVDNMKKTGFAGYVHDFSVDYDDIEVDTIKDIHKNLMKKMI